MLGECRAHLRQRAQHGRSGWRSSTASTAEPLYHPPRLASRLTSGPYGDYVLSVGRIESVKRVDLLVRAMAHGRPRRCGWSSPATARSARTSSALAETLGVADRVTFLGTRRRRRLIELYAGALAVVYPPFDEDFGYVTLEAFLARKPVITCTDSGGPNEFVVDGVNGFVVRAGARGARGGDQPARADSGRARRRWARPAATVAARDHLGRRHREAGRQRCRNSAIIPRHP